MKKAFLFVILLAAACAVALGVMTSKYMATDDYTSEEFRAGYFINDVPVFNMDYETAVKTVSKEYNAGDILVVGEMDQPLGTITDIECTYDIEEQVQNLKKNNKVICALHYYLNVPVNVRVPMTVKRSSKDFRRQVKSVTFLDRGIVTETQDAYVDMDDPSFPIVPEVYGSKPDMDKFLHDILHCVEMGERIFKYREEDYVAMPKVLKDDPQLLAYQKFCRAYLNQTITYDLGEDSFTIPREDLQTLLKKDLSGNASRKKVAKYVKGIAKRYDNVGKPREFKSLTGKTITIDNGTYGWSVDQEAETDQLVKDINSHKDVSREPVWATTGYGDYSLNIGDTYVDVDVNQQKLVYFENGTRKFSTDVVTGCRNNGTLTPTGLYSVLDKSTNVTLKGRNANGSKYESFVNYWMAFLGSSYGMHDASWRSEFGGDIWITNGSHGCINVPPSKMPRLFELVEWGTPVIVHY